MKKFLAAFLMIIFFALSSNAQEHQAGETEKAEMKGHIDYTTHPRSHAHAIILFEPSEDMDLRIPSREERRIRGRVISGIRQHVADDQIFFRPNSFTRPLRILCTNPRLMCLQGPEAQTIQT